MIVEAQAHLLMQVAAEVGNRFAQDYPYLDAEDITQEIITQALEEWRTIAVKIKDAVNHGRTEREVLYFLLSQRAARFCRREGYAYMVRTARTLYTPKEVRALLKVYFDPDTWQVPDKDKDFGVVVEGQSIWVNLSDLKEALLSLPPKTYEVILSAFGPEELYPNRPHYKAISRAVERVTQELNKHLNKEDK